MITTMATYIKAIEAGLEDRAQLQVFFTFQKEVHHETCENHFSQFFKNICLCQDSNQGFLCDWEARYYEAFVLNIWNTLSLIINGYGKKDTPSH